MRGRHKELNEFAESEGISRDQFAELLVKVKSITSFGLFCFFGGFIINSDFRAISRRRFWMMDISEPVPRRRRRPAISCILCRKRKVRCDRKSPCNHCSKSKDATCVYRDGPSRLPTTAASASTHSSTGTDGDHASFSDGATLLDHPGIMIPPSVDSTSFAHAQCPLGPPYHVEVPKNQTTTGLSLSSTASPAASARGSHVETATVGIAGTFHFHRENRQPGLVTRSVAHKTRFFGQSHWFNGVSLLKDMFDILKQHVNDESSKVYRGLKQCKAIARAIKAQRSPPWPCIPTVDLPLKSTSDDLVECYLRSTETLYRVLHIPSFRQEYEALWQPSNTRSDTSFVMLVKMVLAIGAATYDSTFSLRTDAIRWIYEAQTWLSRPEFKHRMGIQTIQINILLLIAREATGVGEDMIWAAAGSLIRTAMFMGLHRDPTHSAPKSTPLAAEMRRRLWNTILELAVQSSLNAGGAPLIGLDDFDAEPPRNYDDDVLAGDILVPQPESVHTQTSAAIALRTTFPQRLAVVKFLNDLSSRGVYQETLKLDTALRTAYKAMKSRVMQARKSPSLSDRMPDTSDYDIRLLDLIMRRYFLALHLPFFGVSLHDTAFEYSRKVTVEASLRVWRAAFPSQLDPLEPMPDNQDVLSRLVTCGSGFFRTLAMQSYIIIASDLKVQLQEEEGLGPVSLRQDLVQVLEDSKVWTWNCIEAGETNMKGYLFTCMVNTQVQCMQQGATEEEISAAVLKTAEEAEDRSLTFFESLPLSPHGQTESVPTIDSITEASVTDMVTVGFGPSFLMQDWDYMATDAFYDQSNATPLDCYLRINPFLG